MSIAVPGELAGLEYAWKKYGSLPWADLFEPAIQLAAGFQVDRFMAEEIRVCITFYHTPVTYSFSYTRFVHLNIIIA